jgi:hypothetical protein
MFRNKNKGEKRGRGRYNSNARAHSSHRAPKKKPNPWQEKVMGIGTEKGHRRQRIKERWFSSQYLPDGRFQFLSSETSKYESFRYVPGCSPEQHKAFLETFKERAIKESLAVQKTSLWAKGLPAEERDAMFTAQYSDPLNDQQDPGRRELTNNILRMVYAGLVHWLPVTILEQVIAQLEPHKSVTPPWSIFLHAAKQNYRTDVPEGMSDYYRLLTTRREVDSNVGQWLTQCSLQWDQLRRGMNRRAKVQWDKESYGFEGAEERAL